MARRQREILPVRDVLDGHLRAVAVEEKTLEQLHSKDAKDDEEGAADQDYVPNGFEAGEKRLYHQL